MVQASYEQNSFLGGEWSPLMQGRTDHPKYKTALSLCFNSLPTEEGACTRRPGFQYVATTRGGNPGRLLPFFNQNQVPYAIELTSSHLRMLNGTSLVFNNDNVSVTAVSTANPAVATIASDKGWATGTIINFFFGTGAPTNPSICQFLKNRQFTVTRLTGTTYSLADSATGSNIDGSLVNFNSGLVTVTASSVLDVATPYYAAAFPSTGIYSVRIVQNELNAILLLGTTAPQALNFSLPTAATNVATVTLSPAQFIDGPYLDIDNTSTILTATLANGAQPNLVTLTASLPAYSANTSYAIGANVTSSGTSYTSLVDNNLGNTPASSPTDWAVINTDICNGTGGFTSADVGRCVRILSEPPLWASGTTYAAGATVKYAAGPGVYLYYVSQAAANTGNAPDTQPNWWLVTTSVNVATWTWGRIKSTSTPAIVVEILGAPVLYTASAIINTFRLGLFGSPGNQAYPDTGTFHGGRLWLTGVLPNRVDGSMSGQFFTFSPTSGDGTVADNNAVSATFLAEELVHIFWMQSLDQGLLCGCLDGEWLITASTLNDPITPTSIDFRRKTKYGCANVLPVKTGLAMVFVQKLKRKLLEYLADVFTQKYSAPNLTETSKHLTQGGIQELAYQEEQIPTVWARRGAVKFPTSGNAILSGVTYRRTSSFVTEAPSFAGWHSHMTGTSQQFESIIVMPSNDGTDEFLTAVVFEPNTSNYHIIQMTAFPGETQTIYSNYYLDDGIVPLCAETAANGGSGQTGITVYGLNPFEGFSVDVWINGLDLGTHLVTNGSFYIAYGSDTNGFFTQANMLLIAGSYFGAAATTLALHAGGTSPIPCVIGYTYTSQGQLLRPGTAVEIGTRTGPPLGHLRRIHKFAVLLANAITRSISFGTIPLSAATKNGFAFNQVTLTGTNARPAILKGETATEFGINYMYNGVHKDTIDCGEDFDGVIYWNVTRPYAATIISIAGFGQGQED